MGIHYELYTRHRQRYCSIYFLFFGRYSAGGSSKKRFVQKEKNYFEGDGQTCENQKASRHSKNS